MKQQKIDIIHGDANGCEGTRPPQGTQSALASVEDGAEAYA